MSAAGKRSKRQARRSKERERQRALQALKRQDYRLTASTAENIGQQTPGRRRQLASARRSGLIDRLFSP